MKCMGTTERKLAEFRREPIAGDVPIDPRFQLSRKADPTPEEIALRAETIQAGWTSDERAERLTVKPLRVELRAAMYCGPE